MCACVCVCVCVRVFVRVRAFVYVCVYGYSYSYLKGTFVTILYNAESYAKSGANQFTRQFFFNKAISFRALLEPYTDDEWLIEIYHV